MIFTIATLLMLGSVSLNAQENSNGSTSTDYSKQPFTIVPIDNDMIVRFVGHYSGTTDHFKLYWSYDEGETWDTFPYEGFEAWWLKVNLGQKLMIRAKPYEGDLGLIDVWDNINDDHSNNTKNGRFFIEGNLSSLNTSSYYGIFWTNHIYGCTNLVNAKNLILPNPTKAGQYKGLFYGCTGLLEAPVLSSATLTEKCYEDMFSGCTSLNYIKCLATDISATDCTKNWLDGVSPSGTFVKASSMNNWPSGASGIPSGWTVSNDEATPSTPTDYSKQYLTFVAIEDGTFKYQYTSPTNALSYSLDNGKTWTALDYNTDTPTVARGKKIMWKGTCTSTNYGGIGNFISSGKFDVEGNIMSLLYGDNFINQTDLSIGSIYTFYKLFKGNTNMVNAENLILPATTLKSHCYYSMFHSCSGLTTAPELPATSLAEGCYGDMFYGCTSLTTAPSLPATTLAMSCYEQMFNGCRSLTTAPSLPATTLASYCYYGMFGGCTSLTTAPSLPATILYNACYCYMFTGCASLTTAPSLPATTLAYACYFEMFGSCTSLTTAPVLSATSLAENCYQYMFSRCSKLDYVKCLAIDISAPNCTENWVEGVSSSGTFVKASSMNSWTRGASGIPSGWTITNAQNKQTKRTIHVAKAGTLPSLISEDEKYQIEELTLTGELNGTDFKFIREMAGDIVSYKNIPTEVYNLPNLTVLHNPTDGILTSLDLSNTKIVEGGENYNYIRNMDYGISGLSTIDNKITPGLFSLTNLKSIILPNSITSIEGKQYGYMYFTDERGDYEQYEEKYISAFPQSLTSIIIPNSVTSIDNGVFYGTVWYNNQPDGLVYAGKIAYKYKGEMPANTQITIKDGTLGIAGSAFYNCSGLTSITIPNSVTSIGNSAFSGCSDLTSIMIPNSVTSIGNSAFSGCSGLTSITIPNSVTSIGNSAFSGCSDLTSVTIPNSISTIHDKTFSGCSGLTSVTIPNSVTSIGEWAFSGCSGLTSVTIPNSVTSIDRGAFSGCSGLTSVTIPNSVTTIGGYAFSSCSSLTSVTIPNSVTSIESDALSGTAWYNNQPDGLVYAGKVAYKYKGEMPANTIIFLENGTLGIAGHAFSGCSGLTSIMISNSVTSIGSSAFQGCSGLTSINIPNSVKSIGSQAFFDCKSLTKVISKIEKPFTISSGVFDWIPSDAELVVPTGTKSLYEATEGWNKFSKITEHLPTLETQPAQPTSTTKARLIALANEEDDDQHFGFEWLRNDAPANMPANKVSAPLYDGRIIGSLGGLNPDIYYKYRPFYKSDTGEMVYGEWIPFLTGDANVFFEPEVHTKDAVVSNDGALLSAVFVEGTEDIQEKGFEYWQKNSNARAVSLTRGNNIGSVIVSGNNTSVTIEGLKAGTEYGYRSYVKTASGITYGEEKTFKTSMFGDVNGDNKVDSNDLNDLVSYIMGIIPPHFNKDVADLNNDNKVNAADIVKMVNILK